MSPEVITSKWELSTEPLPEHQNCMIGSVMGTSMMRMGLRGKVRNIVLREKNGTSVIDVNLVI